MTEKTMIKLQDLRKTVKTIEAAGLDPRPVLEGMIGGRVAKGDKSLEITGDVVEAILNGQDPFAGVEAKEAMAQIDKRALDNYAKAIRNLETARKRVEEASSKLEIPAGWKLVFVDGQPQLRKLRRGGGGSRTDWSQKEFPLYASFKGHDLKLDKGEDGFAVYVDNVLIAEGPHVSTLTTKALQRAGASANTRRNAKDFWRPRAS